MEIKPTKHTGQKHNPPFLASPPSGKKAKTSVQWMVGIVANSLSFTYGLQTGWISPMAKILQSDSSPTGTPLSDYALGWVASVLPITALVFVPIFTWIADKFGRKTGMLLITVPQAASWLLKMFSPTTSTLVMARVCCGAAAGGCFTIVPMYNKEISQDSIRGLIGALLMVCYNLGVLTMYALGAYTDYYTVLYVVVSVPVLVFFLLLMCPESPGYLVKTGKIKEATQKLALLQGLDVEDKTVRNEIEAMKERDEYYKSLPSLSVLVILKDKAWRRACILGTILISVQAFSGNFALVSYGANILAASGTALDPKLQTLSFPVIMMTGAIISMCVVKRVGRRVILLTTYSVSAVALASLAVILQLPEGTAPAWLMLLTIAVSMVAYTAGVLPMPHVIMAELFNIQIRAKMIGIASSTAWIVSFAQLATFAPIKGALGIHTNFYCYAIVHLLGVAAILVLMPETRGKSIEQVEMELRNK